MKHWCSALPCQLNSLVECCTGMPKLWLQILFQAQIFHHSQSKIPRPITWNSEYLYGCCQATTIITSFHAKMHSISFLSFILVIHKSFLSMHSQHARTSSHYTEAFINIFTAQKLYIVEKSTNLKNIPTAYENRNARSNAPSNSSPLESGKMISRGK